MAIILDIGTLNQNSMKQLITLFALLPFTLAAQTTWNVTAGGSTIGGTPPFYDPMDLTINVGDIVHWTNTSGTHNVNGQLNIFPSNPKGFGTGNAQSGSWTYNFTFTIPGVYNYHCTQNGHAATQHGTITVLSGMGVAEVNTSDDVRVYPVPATNVVYVEAANAKSVSVVDLDGAVVASTTAKVGGRTELDVAALSAGKYFVVITDVQGKVTSKPFTKN